VSKFILPSLNSSHYFGRYLLRPLHNTALATLLSTFRLGHLQK